MASIFYARTKNVILNLLIEFHVNLLHFWTRFAHQKTPQKDFEIQFRHTETFNVLNSKWDCRIIVEGFCTCFTHEKTSQLDFPRPIFRLRK